MKKQRSLDFEAFRNVDINTVDPDTLADIRDVEIDENLPVKQRLDGFMRQIKNPYCYKCGNMIIKAVYAKNGVSFEHAVGQSGGHE